MKTLLLLLLSTVLLGVGCSTFVGSTETFLPPRSVGSVNLDLSNQNLTAIPSDIFLRTELEKLNLSNNRLSGAPQSQIGQLQNLTMLDLSSNNLTGLPAELGQLKKLEVLDVSNNKLTGLPMELGNLTQLRILDVSGNAYSKQDLDGIAAKLFATEIRR